MTTEQTGAEKDLEQLRQVRNALLQLHAVLLNYQRRVFERSAEKISNSYKFLDLVMHHEAFAWLHRLSELVVQIDVLLDEEEQPAEQIVALLEQSRFLLVPAETGDDFQQKYFLALQESPEVVLAHADVVKLLGKRAQVH